MSRYFYWCVALAVLLANPLNALAATDADLQAIREQIQQLKQNYEQRITQLEQRLQQAEANSRQAESVAPQAQTAAQQPTRSGTGASSESGFNPAVSLILSGTYGQFKQDTAVAATGFAMSANNPGYTQGLSLKESELGISANIDPQFRGVATFALAPAGGISVENAFVQSSVLGNGINLKMGRFFSGLGYLNEQHAHAWDFVDQPLVYRVLWDNQIGEDGLQLKWLAPTDMFVEVGGELGRGRGFPGTDRQNKNGAGAGVLFAHVGDDIGIEHSWRAGLSLHETRRVNAVSTGVPDLLSTAGGVSNRFSGDSRTAGLDFVWKYAPNGNIRERYLKLQGEYFRRNESGLLTYNLATTDSYAVTQSGWYLQSVYQFMPNWRTGLRYDQLDPGIASVGALNAGNVIGNYAFNPSRLTWMVDYNPSEFSRLRLQLARDNSRQGLPDNQLFLQYIMSLGAHGAHQY
ncbi:MAG: carbohydrate porin [Nitrosomonadales bacterium]|nr:carbohydrate porin [Nitrosomonadales bacterium]